MKEIKKEKGKEKEKEKKGKCIQCSGLQSNELGIDLIYD